MFEYFQFMVGRGRFAMVQPNQSPWTRPGFGLRFTAENWFLGTANQPTFAALKQLELTEAVPCSKAPSTYYGSAIAIWDFCILRDPINSDLLALSYVNPLRSLVFCNHSGRNYY